jgi:hypothetical protein
MHFGETTIDQSIGIDDKQVDLIKIDAKKTVYTQQKSLAANLEVAFENTNEASDLKSCIKVISQLAESEPAYKEILLKVTQKLKKVEK